MATSQYYAFAVGSTPNTMTQTAWAGLQATVGATGFSSGVAASEQFNTLMRQVSVPTAALAKWASDTSGTNAVDDSSVTNFVSLINSAVAAKTEPYLPLTGGTMTGTLNLHSDTGGNYLGKGTGDGASYSLYNFVLSGWYGMGMRDHAGDINGYYDFRAGKWDCKGGFYVNGARTWDQTNFNPGNYLPLTGGTVTGGLTVNGALTGASRIYASSGNASAPAYGFSAETLTGIYHRAGMVVVGVGGVDSFAVTNGNSAFNGTAQFATVAPTDSSTYGATTAHVTNKINALFTGVNGNNGWARHSTGQIEQWMRVSVGDISTVSSGTLTFPIAFPSECSVCLIGASDSLEDGQVIVTLGGSPSTTSCIWRVRETSINLQNVVLHVYARGY